jgi:hypothetical protein
VRLTKQELSCDIALLTELPAPFVELAERSLRLQARVIHLDRSLNERAGAAAENHLAAQRARVEAAFSGN